jgi:hypothetical protein
MFHIIPLLPMIYEAGREVVKVMIGRLDFSKQECAGV